ncbi:hypothetical protein KP509_29G066600 [Ceratopteris richardii]|uniref:Uncharacterized protein n=1 Tax=Ceratopteris richardii TaxID=49495 RepID=A0A8T2R916_CERRI|nr:hypothetical protein KP509_29G066600 [Ceratopteris richardii]
MATLFSSPSLQRSQFLDLRSSFSKVEVRGTSKTRRASLIKCSQEEENDKPTFNFDFSNLQSLDLESIRRSNRHARRKFLQNRGVPRIYPQVYGQATKIEKLWKDWKSAQKDSYSRGLEYLTPESIDPEDEWIIANDGLFIEKKYPEYRTKSTIITKEGELLNW